MAAGGLSEAFSFELKRKRRYDNDDDVMADNGFNSTKRRNLTQLPIRSPPKPSIAVTPAFGQYGMPTGTLTPDSIPEDEVFPSPTADLYAANNRPQNLNVASSGLRLNTNHEDADMDMDVLSPKQSSRPPPTPLRIGRARSDALISPMRSPMTAQLLSPTAGSFARDRTPTPTASSFPARSPFEPSFASAAARHLRPHMMQGSTLSPMVDAESWTPQIQRPPSPGPELDEPFDEDAAMAGVEDSHMMSSSFTNLSVHSQDNLNDMPNIDSSPSSYWSQHSSNISPRTRGLGLDGPSSAPNDLVRPERMRMSTIDESQSNNGFGQQHNRNQSSGRVAKLHMGFKADCEKCIARVPGHYSHIMWS